MIRKSALCDLCRYRHNGHWIGYHERGQVRHVWPNQIRFGQLDSYSLSEYSWLHRHARKIELMAYVSIIAGLAAGSTRSLLTRKRPCGVTACPLILPRSRSPVRRVSAPGSCGTAQFQLTYGMLVGLAASAFFAPMIAAATAWFENNRCLAVSLGAATAFCCQEVHQCRGSADGPHRKYLPVSDRCRLVRPQVRADVQ
jgi:hypothetical protein